MPGLIRTLSVLSMVAQLTLCHFELRWPPTGVEFDDDTEGSGPCGGADITVDDGAQDIHVDQFAVQILSTHPMGQWQFRGTFSTEAPYNFTDLVPIVDTSGVGQFCLTYLSAPSEWAGKQGVIQVIDIAPDGYLYQCAPVSFVSGSNSTIGSTCVNDTNFSADWTSQTTFSADMYSSMTSTDMPSGTGSSESTSMPGFAAMVTPDIGALMGGAALPAALAAVGLGW